MFQRSDQRAAPTQACARLVPPDGLLFRLQMGGLFCSLLGYVAAPVAFVAERSVYVWPGPTRPNYGLAGGWLASSHRRNHTAHRLYILDFLYGFAPSLPLLPPFLESGERLRLQPPKYIMILITSTRRYSAVLLITGVTEVATRSHHHGVTPCMRG